MVEEPTESVVVATPLASVVLCTGFTLPPPDVTAHVTTTPGTARPLASCAVTLRSVGSGLLKYQLCASPPLFVRSVGGPGGDVPPPPPPPQESAPNTAPNPARRFTHANRIASLPQIRVGKSCTR